MGSAGAVLLLLPWLMAAVAIVSATAGVLPAEQRVNTVVKAEPVQVGYRGPSYAAHEVSAPTAEKPQSKLWYYADTWWGVLYSREIHAFTIHRMDRDGGGWADLGMPVDTRRDARMDVRPQDARIYVASASGDDTDARLTLTRYTYEGATDEYRLDAGFPITVLEGPARAPVIDLDSNGMLWMAFTRPEGVYVTHSAGDEQHWSGPQLLQQFAARVPSPEEMASLVAFGAHIGVMWSNQDDDALYFAVHQDGAPDDEWARETVLQEPRAADDHINLTVDGEGRVYAVTKTSFNDDEDATGDEPLILLLVRSPEGQWQRSTVGTVADQHTRPIVLIDRQHRTLFVLAAARGSGGGSIYIKRTSIDAIEFAPGLGQPFIESTTDRHINNVSSTKQPLDSQTGLVAIAGDDHTKYYLFNALSLYYPSPSPVPGG